MPSLEEKERRRSLVQAIKAKEKVKTEAQVQRESLVEKRKHGLIWEKLLDYQCDMYRTKVPGGWLIRTQYTIDIGQPDNGYSVPREGTTGDSICFYPDVSHEWDGKSLL